MKVYNTDNLHILLFQHKMYDLELGYYEVFDNDDFCTDLTRYLERLFSLGHKDIITRILERIGICVAGHKKQEVRAKAFSILTAFTAHLSGQKDRELFQVVSKVVTGWLKNERKPHSEQKKLFDQIVVIAKKMFSLQLWQQSEPMVSVSKRISLGLIPAERFVQEEVSKLHRQIADKEAIQTMVQCFLQTREPGNAAVGALLLALTPHSSEAMIHSLFKCNKKGTRLALLEMILQDNDGVLPILIEKLKDRQPWYVVRNCMVLLGALGDADLYSFARPFLNHPDVRVQREVVACIASLGGCTVSERLVSAFPRVKDELKPCVLEQLRPYKGLHIENLFFDILEQRSIFSSEIQDQLIISICSSGNLQYSKQTVEVLHSIVDERKYRTTENDTVVDLVQKILKNM